MRRILEMYALAVLAVSFAGCNRPRHGDAIPANASSNCLEVAKYISTLPELIASKRLQDHGEFNRGIFTMCSALSNDVEVAYIARELENVALRSDLRQLDFQGWQYAESWIREFLFVARGMFSSVSGGCEEALESWFRELDFFDAECERCELEARRCEKAARRCYEKARKFELSGDCESGREARTAGGKCSRAHCNFMHQASLCRGTLSATCNLVVDSESSILAKFCKENPDKANKMIARVSKRIGRKPLWCK